MAGSRRFAAGAALVALLGSGGYLRSQGSPGSQGAQSPSPQTQPAQASPQTDQQPPIFRAGVNVVRVDVIVTDKSGKPISDLKPDDFEVTEGGKAQKIETFKLVSLDGGLLAGLDAPPVAIRTDADEEVEAARDDVRLFAMFLDDYHVRKDSSLVMRQQLARFIETQLGPSDMIGLMSPLEAMAAVRMTRNHNAVQRALEQFEGRKYDYRPQNAAEESYVYRVSAEQIEQIRNQVSFSAIKALIRHMGALKDGRKALILVSEGYSSVLPPQLRDTGGAPAGGTFTPADSTAGNDPREVTRQLFASVDINTELRDIYDLANRNNVAIYAVDPRGLATSEFSIDQPAVNARTDSQYLNGTMDTLRVLAENSDGRAILNRNDLAIGMKQIIIDSSAYYLLGYNSTMTAPDGKFHEIKVSLKVKRPGVEIRHRKGYWALKPDDAAKMAAAASRATAAAPVSPVAAALAATSTPRSRAIRTWIGTERGENGKTRVTFVWEPVAKTPGEVVRDSDRPARVALTASGADGPQYFRGRVPETAVPPVAGALAGSRVTFEAQPGRMQLRLSVEGQGADVIDSEVREVTVPDLSSPQTTFATPQLFRARSLPELQRLKGEPQPVPVAARDFSRSERLLLRVAVYGPAGTTPALKALMVNRGGQTMSELPVATAGSSGGLSQVEVSLANLSPGDYGISLTATGEGGNATELVAFRVTN